MPGAPRRAPFVGANVAWLLGCATSWGGVFLVAVALQSLLGY
jgi:hypothetical protein